VPVLPVADHPAMFRSSTHGFVDFSEDVSSKDIVAAAKEGYDSSELVKRFTTATMGPSQGKLEVINTVAVLGEATGRQVADLGTTVWRPPYAPISLGALAGGSSSRPGCPRCSRGTRAPGRRRCWRAVGPAGPLRRRGRRGPQRPRERRDHRRHPLGKLELQGPDVAKLLNLVYVNKWSKLDVGSVRYGVMCAEDGVVMDDGVTAGWPRTAT
jgi:sarcosine oxidase subunit alpha